MRLSTKYEVKDEENIEPIFGTIFNTFIFSYF